MNFRFEEFMECYQQFRLRGIDFAVVTLSKVIGSAPQDLGARMIVTGAGIGWGTVGGGKVESFAIQKAQELLKLLTQSPTTISTELTHCFEVNLQKDLGMSCGGAVSFLFELVPAKSLWQIAVFGAGHVAQELIPLLVRLEAQVTCYDSRQEWLAKIPNASNLKKYQVAELESVVADLPLKTYVVSVTMGHAYDLPIMSQALPRGFPYVGVIGSQVKAKKLQQDLKKRGLSDQQVQQMICPIGEAFGSKAPFEIAVSIISQLLRVRAEFAPRDRVDHSARYE